MENHATRKEFAAALTGKVGENERRSATLGIPFLYVAAPVSGGAVRLAYPLSDVEAVQAQVHRRLIWGSSLAFIIALAHRRLRLRLDLPPPRAHRRRRRPHRAGRPPCPRRRQARSMKLAASPPPSTKPPARSSAVLPPCVPASASSKLCSTACRMPSSPSAPTAWCSGPISPWIASFPSTRASTLRWSRPSAIPISSPPSKPRPPPNRSRPPAPPPSFPAAPSMSPPRPCPMAAPSPCSAISPRPSASRKPAAISSPTFPTNSARP